MNDKITRILIGTGIFLTLVFSLNLGGWLLTSVMLILWWFASSEYINIVRARGYNPSNYWIKFTSLLFILTASLPNLGYSISTPIKFYIFVCIFGVVGCFFRLVFRGADKDDEPLATIADISTSVLGFIYTGLLPSFLILLQQLDFVYALGACFCTAMCDVGAYYGGRMFGKNKLSPKISPKKTVEGSITGFIASMVSSIFIFIMAKDLFNHQILHAISIGCFTGIFSQFGDLFESLLKRDAGLKDSGTALMSHGGVLDRIDGYLFVLWAVYIYVKWVVVGDF